MINLHILKLAILQTLGETILLLPLFVFVNTYYKLTKSMICKKVGFITYAIEKTTIYAFAILTNPSIIYTAIFCDITANILTSYIIRRIIRFRFLINQSDLQDAIDILNNNNIPFDTDDYGQIMITENYTTKATKLWDATGINYDEI